MKSVLRIALLLAATALAAMALVWTFLWMPEAFRATDPAIHAQVKYGYIQGAVLALLSIGAFLSARRIKPAQITKGTS